MLEIIREAALGQLIRFVSGKRLLRYPEEEPGFEPVFEHAAPPKNIDETTPGSRSLSTASEKESAIDPENKQQQNETLSSTPALTAVQTQKDHDLEENGDAMNIEKTLSTQGKIVVTWYGPDDPANPQNWTVNKKNYITFLIW